MEIKINQNKSLSIDDGIEESPRLADDQNRKTQYKPNI